LGLSDLFSREGRARRGLQKTIQRASDKHAQSIDRWKALEQLRDDSSDEALVGLLRRFSFNYDKTIEDEQEKEWVFETLAGIGSKVLPALRTYMRETETLAWPLKILERISSGDTLLETLRMLCEWNDNSYVRDPSKKIQLVHFLGEHRRAEIAAMIVPYLEDIDEGVRFKAVEGLLFQLGGPPGETAQAIREATLAPLIQLLGNPKEESRRIKVRIIEGLAELALPLPEHAPTVDQAISELGIEARLDREKRIKLPTAK
jgi:hypothetical protein